MSQLHYYGPAPTDSSGVLCCFVQQPTDSALTKDSSQVYTFQEKWKGPYAVGQQIAIRAGDSITAAHTALGTNRISRIPAPPAPANITGSAIWIVSNIQVNELQAGDHCELTITYKASDQGFDIAQEDENQRSWNVQWQTYTVSPYAFCSNEQHTDHSITDPAGSNDNYTLKAMREHIDLYKSAPTQDKALNSAQGAFVYPSGSGYWFLNDTERAILKKAELGKQALYHYPVVTYTQVYYGSLSSEASGLSVGSSIDVSCDLPSDCPYAFDDVWKWLKVGEDITQTYNSKTKLKRYDFKTTYWGSKYIDPNFYAPPSSPFVHDKETIEKGRWEEGKL